MRSPAPAPTPPPPAIDRVGGAIQADDAPVFAGLPPEGKCPDFTGAAGDPDAIDAGEPLVAEGQTLLLDDLLALAQLLPEEVWTHRESFFFEGMQMEIGSCHRRYPVAAFYADATASFAGRSRLDEKGNLHDYVAGLPFPTEAIDPAAPDAAMRWAWNFQHRYRGAGPVGEFRIIDLPTRFMARKMGTAMTYRGEFFFLRTGHRADLAVTDYRMPESKKTTWVAGGKFEEPFSVRHLAWRQLRPREAAEDYTEPDDTFVYVPELRKPRRAASAWIDGIYTPRYTVAGEADAGVIPIGVGNSGSSAETAIPNVATIETGAGKAIAVTEDIRRGFTGLALRPNAYEWRLVGMKEVLAPLNTLEQGWPAESDRNYGPSGLSVANDRWDVRYAVVIEGTAKKIVDDVGRITLWVDYQTQQPLYFIGRRRDGLLVDIGILVHRFSSDRAGYPAWPTGELAHVFDPVASVFYVVRGDGGWRRESYDVQSVPIAPETLRKYTSTDELVKGR